MSDSDQLAKYLPLSEATSYILLTLIEPLHGYAVMQKVEEISAGNVTIGPGTLYGAFSNLEKEGFIKMVQEQDRRKCYALTPKGKRLLKLQAERLAILNQNAQQAISFL
jgi:DNA-binding PadR family transcriptional regulator